MSERHLFNLLKIKVMTIEFAFKKLRDLGISVFRHKTLGCYVLFHPDMKHHATCDSLITFIRDCRLSADLTNPLNSASAKRKFAWMVLDPSAYFWFTACNAVLLDSDLLELVCY